MKRLILAMVLGAYSLSAQSALIDRGGGFIYDDVLDITWTQDANINGPGNWPTQVAWVASLSITDTRPGAGGVIYTDWRLPSMNINGDNLIVNCSTAPELACQDNEYGYLYHQYGVTAATPGLFTNFQSPHYWSSTEYNVGIDNAWFYYFTNGDQAHATIGSSYYALAVRSGDVASAVPIPAAAWLFGSGLGLLGWMRRRVS